MIRAQKDILPVDMDKGTKNGIGFIKENYDQLLHNLLEQVLLLGSMVEDNVHCSVNASSSATIMLPAGL